MSEKPEGVRGKADMSAFDAQFEGDGVVDTLVQAFKKAEAQADQVLSSVAVAVRLRDAYDRAMSEAELPDKSLHNKLQHLSEAYSAALDLESMEVPPAPTALTDLQVRIIATKALIYHEESRKSAD